MVNICIDDFTKKVIGKIDSIDMPNLGMDVKQGQTMFTIKQGAVTFFNDDINKLYEYIKKSVSSTKDESRIPADGHVYMGELEELKDKNINAIVYDFFIR